MRKPILTLFLISTSFCGLGDEYKAYKYPGYKKEHTTRENFEDVAIGLATSVSLASLSYFCSMSGSPPLMCVGYICKVFAAGCIVTSQMFAKEIEVGNGHI